MGLHATQYKGLLGWIDARMPSLMTAFRTHMSEYYAPKNFNFWYFFGSFALMVLVIQLVSGILLAMHYKPDANLAFWSVEFIMREVHGGWFIRYMHSTGASFFFIAVYMHMFRGMLYGSYKKPRELVWLMGWLIFAALMAESFFGYLLPWGQMSFWGAQVIINLFDSIPLIGKWLSTWIRGDFVVGDATLNRFFSFHVVLVPLVLLGLVVGHIFALHDVGSNNPDGVEIKDRTDAKGRPLDGIPFHPYYTVHDLYGLGFFFTAYCAVLFFAPEMFGVFLEGNNFIPADPFQTPTHIAPLWYFTPYYSVLRATTSDFRLWIALAAVVLGVAVFTFMRARTRGVRYTVLAVMILAFVFAIVPKLQQDQRLWGVILMGLSVMVFALLPWLDQSPVRSIRYRPGWHKIVIGIFVVAFFVLGYLGVSPTTPTRTLVAQLCTAWYFAFFLLMPWWSRTGTFKPVPDRVTFAAH